MLSFFDKRTKKDYDCVEEKNFCYRTVETNDNISGLQKSDPVWVGPPIYFWNIPREPVASQPNTQELKG